jgi:hypothetical protein
VSVLWSKNEKKAENKAKIKLKPKTKQRERRIVNAYDCYRCHKPVRLTKEENQAGKLYHIMWINYKEYWAKLCIGCTLNLEEFLGVKWYKNSDLTA